MILLPRTFTEFRIANCRKKWGRRLCRRWSRRTDGNTRPGTKNVAIINHFYEQMFYGIFFKTQTRCGSISVKTNSPIQLHKWTRRTNWHCRSSLNAEEEMTRVHAINYTSFHIRPFTYIGDGIVARETNKEELQSQFVQFVHQVNLNQRIIILPGERTASIINLWTLTRLSNISQTKISYLYL